MNVSFGLVIASGCILFLGGCASQGYSVVASSATVFGASISQNPSTGGMSGTVGYRRGEFAFVPTNRNGDKASKNSTGNGAKDSANVIMDFYYGGWTDGSLYQRMAIGDKAVQSSALMFARDNTGKINDSAAMALAAVKGVPAVSSDITHRLSTLNTEYKKATAESKGVFDAAANQAGYTSFKNLMDHQDNVTADELDKVESYLKKHGS